MPGRSHTLGAAARAVLLTLGLLLVLGGCGSSPSPPTGPRSVEPTPISQLNTDALQLARLEFCDLVPPGAVRDALGGGGASTERSWRNGDRAEVETGVRDVVHEFGCSWARRGYAAGAWLFARSVTPAYAQTVIDKTSRRPGCRSTRRPGFGAPSQRQVCDLPDGSHRVRISGLFDDDWLTCQVSGPAAQPVRLVGKRAAAWCVQVANATNTAQ